MAVRADRFTQVEKVAWIVISFALFIVEINSIYKDRAGYEKRQVEVETRERSMLEGIESLRETETSRSDSEAALLTEVQAQHRAGARAPEETLKVRALRLSKDILDFLTDRQRHDPQPSMPTPDVFAFSRTGEQARTNDPASQYVRDTRLLFEHRFSLRIQDVRDGLSSEALSDFWLDAISGSAVSTWAGNSDSVIRQIANTIRKLALLLPPTGIYARLSANELADAAIAESDKLDSLTKESITKLESGSRDKVAQQDLDNVRGVFGSDFRSCCLEEVRNLRGALIERLGPQVSDESEKFAFFALMDTETKITRVLGEAANYSPYLRKFGEELRQHGH